MDNLDTFVLIGGPALIALLFLYAAYNAVAATVNGARRTVRVGIRAARFVAGHQVAPAAPVYAETDDIFAPAPSTTPTVAGSQYALSA